MIEVEGLEQDVRGHDEGGVVFEDLPERVELDVFKSLEVVGKGRKVQMAVDKGIAMARKVFCARHHAGFDMS